MSSSQGTEHKIVVRRAGERGHANHGWLDSYHTFSFGEYYDVQHMGFRSLRVINEDRVAGGEGFGLHPHRDMEIFTYVIEGALQHEDSMGHASVIHAGSIQKITAGTGIEHSEFNGSKEAEVHFLQIWIVPNKKGLTPGYQEIAVVPAKDSHPLLLIGSPEGGKDIVQFNQDVQVFKGYLQSAESCTYQIQSGRGVWIQVISGELEMNEVVLLSGDGAAVENIGTLWLNAKEGAAFMLFDMA